MLVESTASTLVNNSKLVLGEVVLQYFDTVSWASERASGL